MMKREETMKHKRFWQKIVFARCKKIDNNKEAKKKDEHKLDVIFFLENVYIDLKCHQNDKN